MGFYWGTSRPIRNLKHTMRTFRKSEGRDVVSLCGLHDPWSKRSPSCRFPFPVDEDLDGDPEPSDTRRHLSGYIFRAAINAGLRGTT